jgi:hypothetical protein
MSIMDIFKGFAGVPNNTTNPAPQNQQQGPQSQLDPSRAANAQAVQTAGVAANGVLPQVTVDEANKPPLDNYKDLWNNVDKGDGKGPETYFNVDQKQLMDSARKQNFVDAVTPEQMALIAAGGQDAVKALLDTMTTTQIVEQALAKAETKFSSLVPDMVKSAGVSESVMSSNPMFSNPAAQPIISALATQLRVKHPTASVQEITSMVHDYTKDFAKMFNTDAKEAEAAKAKSNEPTDWAQTLGFS